MIYVITASIPVESAKEYANSESEEIKKYRKEIYICPTMGTFGKVMNTLSKIRKASDYTISFNGKDVPARIADADIPEKARKICAFGVRCSRWVTMHGFAFNVNVNLDYFNHIIPCGIPDKAVTSLNKELGMDLDMDEVKGKLKMHLSEIFNFTLMEFPSSENLKP